MALLGFDFALKHLNVAHPVLNIDKPSLQLT